MWSPVRIIGRAGPFGQNCPVTVASPSVPTRRALVPGVGTFAGGDDGGEERPSTGWPDLDFAAGRVREVADALADLGLPRSQVQLLLDPVSPRREGRS
jgi:hypothetical protein